MPVRNLAVAAALSEIADRLEIEEANPFRVRAYRNAARTVQELGEDVGDLVARGGTLAGRPGIGADLAGKIAEIATSGHCAVLDQLRRDMPPAITELLQVPGLGPKRVRTLWQELDVRTPEQVLRAAREQRIRGVHGFGETIEHNIERALAAHLSKEQRTKLAVATEHAAALVDWVRAAPGVRDIDVAGSFRRRRDTVGDLDIVVSAARGQAVTRRFVSYPDAAHVLAEGPTRASVRLTDGLSVDLRVVARESFGAALAYFTGSKAHNIALRRIAQDRGLKLNEYGLFRGTRRIAGATEAGVYAALGLAWIPAGAP
jgi:DNA polymerase (family 10)